MEKEWRLVSGVFLTVAILMLFMKPKLTTSGVISCENGTRSLPPTEVDIGEPGTEWEGVETSEEVDEL